MDERPEDAFLDELQRRAMEAAAESSRDLGEEQVDLLGALRSNGNPVDAAPDVTLGGYIKVHDRPPAFEGSDAQPYTVGIDVEETGAPDRPYAGFLVFVRWAATGAGIMAHVESGDVAYGSTPDEARQGVLDLSLYEVKAELDAAIERKRADMED